MRAALAAGLILVGAGCALPPPLEPQAVRLAAGGGLALPAGELTMAREDAAEGRDRETVRGDDVRLARDLGLDPGAVIDLEAALRPTPDDALVASLRWTPELRGQETLGRERHFDGSIYGPDERVWSSVTWLRLHAGYARRVLAPRGGLDLDLHARLGLERTDLSSSLRGARTAEQHRDLRVGAPWAGLEGQVLVLAAPRGVVHVGVDAGYWHHDGVRLALVDAWAGLRLDLVGPLFTDLRYGVAYRDGEADLGDGEVSRVALLSHDLTALIGLAF